MKTLFFKINPIKFGKGFITHEDCKFLKFSMVGDIIRVVGEAVDIEYWFRRIGCDVASVEAYDAQIALMEESNRDNNLENLKAGFKILKSKLDQIINKLEA